MLVLLVRPPQQHSHRRRRTQSRQRFVARPPSRRVSKVLKLKPYAQSPACRAHTPPASWADVRAATASSTPSGVSRSPAASCNALAPSVLWKGGGSKPPNWGIEAAAGFQPASIQ